MSTRAKRRSVVALWGTLLLAVCGVLGPWGAPAQEAKDQWTVGLGEEADTLDPPNSPSFTAELYMLHVLDGLVGVEGPDLKPVGLLAERWEIVNPTTWRFHLRRGVKFHNGDAFDAEDVKYSINAYLEPKNRRYSYAQAIQRVDMRDPYTVDVVTSKPSAALLTNLSRLFILPRGVREKMGAEAFGQRAVGTGPYRLVEWVRDQRLVLEANPTYWRGAPNPKRLVFRAIKDPSTRAAELRTGGVDIIVAPPLPQLEQLDRGETQVVPVKGGRLMIHLFHLKQPPFDNAKVRQAANLAVNREAIVRTVLRGQGVPMAGPLVAGWLGYDPSVPAYPYDPARAKQLLTEAGSRRASTRLEHLVGRVPEGHGSGRGGGEPAPRRGDPGDPGADGPCEAPEGRAGRDVPGHRPKRVGHPVRARPHAQLVHDQTAPDDAARPRAARRGAQRGRRGEASADLPGALPDRARGRSLAVRARPGRAVGQATHAAVGPVHRGGWAGVHLLLPGPGRAMRRGDPGRESR